MDDLALGEIVLEISRAERTVGIPEVSVVGAEGGRGVPEKARALGDTRIDHLAWQSERVCGKQKHATAFNIQQETIDKNNNNNNTNNNMTQTKTTKTYDTREQNACANEPKTGNQGDKQGTNA